MARVGLCPFLGRGHLNPLAALGRALVAAGHSVTAFHLTVANRAVQRAGLEHIAIDRLPESAEPDATEMTSAHAAWRGTRGVVNRQITRMLAEGPRALKTAGIEVLIVDHMDLAAGSVAEYLGIPFVSVSISPPIELNDEVPPAYFGLEELSGPTRRPVAARCNRIILRITTSGRHRINEWRSANSLSPLADIKEVLSAIAIITQMPKCFDLPRRHPAPRLYYTGPFRDAWTDPVASFPWQRLNGKPVIFASLGTVRNNNLRMFEIIAEAAAMPEYQLVIALGGGRLSPRDLKLFATDSIVADYIPQRDLLAHCALVINCAGLNTTFDCIAARVPMVAVPIAEDQPGVAIRIHRAGIGEVIPARHLTIERLRNTIAKVLGNPRYLECVSEVSPEIAAIDGIGMAVGIITGVLKLG
jgi:zeaxanthin glucosyltransferase